MITWWCSNSICQSSETLACAEGRVEATAHSLVAAEAEGDVGHAPADLGARAHALDLPRGADKVHGIVVVLSHAGADGQDIGVKDDILQGQGSNRMKLTGTCELR
eukprot:1159591-Pelagomonas_calceolata.AAC.9